MLGRVVVENGVKKIVPLTADCGSGNPCGAIITVYQRTVPNGYLPLGAQYDITQFPVLYSILGTDTIPTASALGLPTLTTGQYVIKATSGINENQADNVLSALSPVDSVTDGDMHAVTSNAVADKINSLDVSSVGGSGKYISAISEADGKINATATNLATSIASGGTTPPTSGAVYDNLITLLRTNNFRVFTLGGDGTQNNLRITYSGGVRYSAIGFLIISRYSIEFVHIETNENGAFYAMKNNIIAKRSTWSVTVSNTDDTITVSDNANWNTWTILMFTAEGSIFENISFRAVT